MTTIGDVENAILAQLKAAGDAGVLGYRYAELDSYPLNFDQYILAETRRFPAAWIVWGAWSNGKLQGSGGYELPTRFVLVVAAKSLRNEVATRQGSGDQVGSYQLLLDACRLLANQTLGLDINPIRIGAARSLFNAKLQQERKVNLIALDLDTSLFLEAGPTPVQARDVDPFTLFHVDWDVPPFGNVGPELPDPDHADASDDVDLKGAPAC